ncbi:MAG: helicase HerA domain-containing protein [Calditrichia bacterium]
MSVFEKLGQFYLGKVYDSKKEETTDNYLLYDSKDLVTHAMCVGMTGSGKTGLCIGLLEEAAIDNIPAIIIDPKGDMGNLLLGFPGLSKKEFLPWVNPDEASQKNLSTEEFADKQAALWKKGLAGWGQDGKRIKKLHDTAEFTIYTPGSSAGLPVSIVRSFAAPSAQDLGDMDLLRDRVQTTASGLLQLLGIKGDPLQSREHILLASIIETSWLAGKDLGLADIIQMIQNPPMKQIGVFDIESFYPSKERFKLAMTLNNLLAAPGFKPWMEGEALEIDSMLFSPEGKPKISIFSIAHLSDSERMFFVTLLLNQLLGWMRRQSGTTSLRALLYMDEVFGYLPPIGEPPSKKPLLTLLKQARAFGLGVVLSTQNPVDLDYKGLSNMGTWFIGRLQSENDKNRLIEGLTSARGSGLDKKTLMSLISNLQKRVFLMNNVHEKEPVLFSTRWVMSYLRGPLTRDHIKVLMDDKKASKVEKPKKSSGKVKNVAATASTPGGRPNLPPDINQYFSPIYKRITGTVTYHPYLFAGGDVHVMNARYNVSQKGEVAHILAIGDDVGLPVWDESETFTFHTDILHTEPEHGASYLAPGSAILKTATYNKLDKQYESYVYRNYSLRLFQSKLFKLTSQPHETEGDFRRRLREAAHEKRDLEMERLRRTYGKKITSLEKQLHTAQQRVDRESDQYSQKKMNTAISVGSTILGMFLGGRASRTGVSRAARSASSMSKEKRDIERAQQKLAQVEARIVEMEQIMEDELNALAEKFDPDLEELKEVSVRAKKSNILQRYYGILWLPYIHSEDGQITPLFEEQD